MSESYAQTRARLETYFDRTAAATWARLTSDAPVSRIRQTVREGRDAMRATLLSRLPEDLSGARVLDAGCGAGQMAHELAQRGAQVLAVDISPKLLDVARERTPPALRGAIRFEAGDMLDARHGAFDYVVAMDSLIHYHAPDIAAALEGLTARTGEAMLFTVAPRTPLLSAMHAVGQIFPRSDRSPAIAPVSATRLERELERRPDAADWRLATIERIARGFYISQAMELRK